MADKRWVSSRHRGVALLAIVLVGFVMLSIVSAIAINIAWRTSHVEGWQKAHVEKRQLNYMAISTAAAVIDAVSNDAHFSSVTSGEVTETQTINQDGLSVSLNITIKTTQNGSRSTVTVNAVSGDVTTRALATLNKTTGAVTWETRQ